MTCSAERDQVFFGVITETASPPLVMDIEIHHRPAALTAPPVAFQDSQPKLFVLLRFHTTGWQSSPNLAPAIEVVKPVAPRAAEISPIKALAFPELESRTSSNGDNA